MAVYNTLIGKMQTTRTDSYNDRRTNTVGYTTTNVAADAEARDVIWQYMRNIMDLTSRSRENEKVTYTYNFI